MTDRMFYKAFFITAAFLFLEGISRAQLPCRDTFPQSLFENASFEDHGECNAFWRGEGGLIDGGSSAVLMYVPHWHAVNTSQSPRYYNLDCRIPGISLFDNGYLYSNTGYPGIPNPKPDGKGLISIEQYNYYESEDNKAENRTKKVYVTQCLTNKLKAGITYCLDFRFAFSLFNPNFNDVTGVWSSPSPFGVGIFGRTDCPDFPIKNNSPDSSLGCLADRPGWMSLGQVQLHGYRQWVEGLIEFTPTQDISALAVGPSCDFNSGIADTFALYYMDNFILAKKTDFAFKNITAINGNVCTGHFQLQAPAYNDASYQWYRDGLPIDNATSQTYSVPDNAEGYYVVNISLPGICFNSTPYPVYYSPLRNFIMPADTVVVCSPDAATLNATWPGAENYLWQDGSTNAVFNATTSGTYSVQVTDINGCTQNKSVEVRVENCDDCKVYLPNAFTPNNDGLNDQFKPLLPDCQNVGFEHYQINIYNRFGQPVFQSKNAAEGWKGIFNGNAAPQGVYVYTIQYNFKENKPVQKKGTVLLMR
ncbi:MAG TPA: gliding motility-associated C-terminal domain-containing protein [Panacibacter sp.]|nr:gliding motility-associated C-terminal domain-containing protein [Panacibacter sp.]